MRKTWVYTLRVWSADPIFGECSQNPMQRLQHPAKGLTFFWRLCIISFDFIILHFPTVIPNKYESYHATTRRKSPKCKFWECSVRKHWIFSLYHPTHLSPRAKLCLIAHRVSCGAMAALTWIFLSNAFQNYSTLTTSLSAKSTPMSFLSWTGGVLYAPFGGWRSNGLTKSFYLPWFLLIHRVFFFASMQPAMHRLDHWCRVCFQEYHGQVLFFKVKILKKFWRFLRRF